MTRLRTGFIPLADATALLVAVDKGFCALEGRYDAARDAGDAPSLGEPADGIGAFAGPMFDPDDIEAYLGPGTSSARSEAYDTEACGRLPEPEN